MEWMILPFRRYADFSGRSRRKEYWMFFVLNLVIAVVLNVVLGGMMLGDGGDGTSGTMGGALVLLLYALVAFIPGLAVTVRRFHDQDRSGWMVLLGLIPFVGGLILLVFMCLEGTHGPNRFGSDPKATGNQPVVA